VPASKPEQVLQALTALLETVPDAVVERSSVLPEKIPAGGLIILRDGDPGEPEQALGGFANTYYQHAVEIEVYVEEGDAAARDVAFDALLQQIGAALDGADGREGRASDQQPHRRQRGSMSGAISEEGHGGSTADSGPLPSPPSRRHQIRRLDGQ
jgi:hypothetical protein